MLSFLLVAFTFWVNVTLLLPPCLVRPHACQAQPPECPSRTPGGGIHSPGQGPACLLAAMDLLTTLLARSLWGKIRWHHGGWDISSWASPVFPTVVTAGNSRCVCKSPGGRLKGKDQGS